MIGADRRHREKPMDQQQLTVKQFGTNAEYYLASEVHAKGHDLEQLVAVVRQRSAVRALDLGCGAGHVAYALARGGAGRIIAYDPSAEMLSVVAQEALRRGHDAIETRVGAAEDLPFENGSFDLVVTRYSAHHWANVPRALEECARVTAAGGLLIVIDVIAPEEPLLDTSLQVIEFLRDASHVRDYRLSEWRSMLSVAGFVDASVSSWKTAIDFPTWIARIGTPPARVAALHTVFPALPREANDYFKITEMFSFQFDSGWIESTKAG
jgi:ubiquinone/menaquinone biosynthesis C-methylase UbiE